MWILPLGINIDITGDDVIAIVCIVGVCWVVVTILKKYVM